MKPDQDAKKIRVLLSGHLPPPMGGIATYYQTLLSSSLPDRAEVRFVETSSQNRPLSKTGRWSFANVLWAAADCGRFARAVAAQRPQLAHIATSYGLSFVKHTVCVVLARLLGSRVLLHPHCSFAMLYRQRSAVWQWYFRQVIRLTQGVVALSSEWQQVRDVVPGCRVYDLPNAINLGPYHQVGLDKIESANTPTRLQVLYLGYLGKAKGTFDLLGAARIAQAQPEAVTFELVGEEHVAGEWEQLQQAVTDWHLEQSVQLQPAVSGEDKVNRFRTADLFVYPSYAEGLPMAVIEAMACALPIVATRVGGLPDLVTTGVNGLLVEAGQPQQLAEAIHHLAVDRELRAAMQLNSFRRAQEQYDIEQSVLRLLGIYARVVAGPAAADQSPTPIPPQVDRL